MAIRDDDSVKIELPSLDQFSTREDITYGFGQGRYVL